MVWLHGTGEDGQGVDMAINPDGVLPKRLIFGTPVRYTKRDGRYEVLGLDGLNALQYLAGVAVAEQSQVELSQLNYGTLQPTQPASMRCIVRGAFYSQNDTLYYVADQYTADFSASPDDVDSNPIDIPTINATALAVLVQLDPTTGALSYKQGAEFDAELTHTQAFAAGYYPQRDALRFAIGYVKLVKGITTLTASHLWNAAEVLTAGGSGTLRVNLLENGAFNRNTIGASPSFPGWTLFGAGATLAISTSPKHDGEYAAALTRAGTDCFIYNNAYASYLPLGADRTKSLTLACWVRQTVANIASIYISDGVSTVTSTPTANTGVWELHKISITVDATATNLEVRLRVSTSNGTAYFDSAMLVIGELADDYVYVPHLPVEGFERQFTGATASTSGARGVVPEPLSAYVNYALLADGNWGLLGAAGMKLPGLNNGRLSLSSGVPVTTSDVTGATTIYWVPYKGNEISLYDGSTWVGLHETEKSVAVPSTVCQCFDIFGYKSSGALALETLNWNAPTSAAVTSISNASPRVVSTGTTPTTGQLVVITGNSVAANNGLWRVGTVVAGVSFQLLNRDGTNSSAPGSVGTGGTWIRADENTSRATALAWQNGVRVKSGDATRKYLGTGRTTHVSGQCEVSALRVLLANRYHQLLRTLTVTDATANWSVVVGSLRPKNNDLVNRVELVALEDDVHVLASMIIAFNLGASEEATGGVGLDSISAVSGYFGRTTAGAGSAINAQLIAFYEGAPGAGYHYLQELERAVAGTVTFLGNNANNQRSGLYATVMA
jgi:hypothetical protein